MKNKVLLFVIAALAIVGIAVTFIPAASATDAEMIDTVEETTVPVGISSDVVEVIENSGSKGEAIITLAEKLGITVDEAETIINAVIEVGDEYAGDSAWWISFKSNVEEDIQFWAVTIVFVVAAGAIGGTGFVLFGKTNPTMKKAMWGMSEAMKINNEIKDENSQTLGEMKAVFEESAREKAAFEKIIEEKEEKIIAMQSKIDGLEEAAKAERTNMVKAEIYNLRMLKLICDRTAMPLTDKATIDLFYAKGIESLKNELSPEDVEKIEKTMATLNVVGDGGNA